MKLMQMYCGYSLKQKRSMDLCEKGRLNKLLSVLSVNKLFFFISAYIDHGIFLKNCPAQETFVYLCCFFTMSTTVTWSVDVKEPVQSVFLTPSLA